MACMKCEYNVVRNIRNATTSIGRGADGLVELIVVLNVGYGRPILSAFVIDVDLHSIVRGDIIISVL